MDTLGKKYESKFKEDWEKIPNTSIDRLYDPVGGYRGINNICDFIIYNYPYIIYAECKTIKGNTFPFANLKKNSKRTKMYGLKQQKNLTQYDKLIKKDGIKGVIAGVFIWFYEKDKVLFVPIGVCRQMMEDGEKSVNCKKFCENSYKKSYNIIDIPSKKKRTFMESDYSVILKGDILDE